MMIVREFIDKDTCGKNRVFVEATCDNCDNIFTRQKRQLHAEFHACNTTCLNILKGITQEVRCAHCGESIVRSRSKLTKSKSGLYFCDRLCKEEAQKYIEAIQPDHYGTGTGKSSYRRLALDFYEEKCSLCGYNENVNALEVHHIDRNRSNNDIENLIILCANCHAIHHRGS